MLVHQTFRARRQLINSCWTVAHCKPASDPPRHAGLMDAAHILKSRKMPELTQEVVMAALGVSTGYAVYAGYAGR